MKNLKKAIPTAFVIGLISLGGTSVQAGTEGYIDPELKPITAERQEQMMNAFEDRVKLPVLNLISEIEAHGEISAFSSDAYFENAEDRPMTEERLNQKKLIFESRMGSMMSRQEYQDIDSVLWAGATMFVRYDNTNFRATANGVSLGHVHSGTRVTHLGGWTTVDGHFWENVRIETGQNAGRTGWIRGDLLRF